MPVLVKVEEEAEVLTTEEREMVGLQKNIDKLIKIKLNILFNSLREPLL